MYRTSILLTYSCDFHARADFLTRASCLVVFMCVLISLRTCPSFCACHCTTTDNNHSNTCPKIYFHFYIMVYCCAVHGLSTLDKKHACCVLLRHKLHQVKIYTQERSCNYGDIHCGIPSTFLHSCST